MLIVLICDDKHCVKSAQARGFSCSVTWQTEICACPAPRLVIKHNTKTSGCEEGALGNGEPARCPPENAAEASGVEIIWTNTHLHSQLPFCQCRRCCSLTTLKNPEDVPPGVSSQLYASGNNICIMRCVHSERMCCPWLSCGMSIKKPCAREVLPQLTNPTVSPRRIQ